MISRKPSPATPYRRQIATISLCRPRLVFEELDLTELRREESQFLP